MRAWRKALCAALIAAILIGAPKIVALTTVEEKEPRATNQEDGRAEWTRLGDPVALQYLSTLEAREWRLGEEHPATLSSVSDLAKFYHSQGIYDEAELLFLRALEARERVLGKEHTDTLSSVHNLGVLYNSQGLYDQAEPLFLRALEARERVLGAEHPSTLNSVNGLAVLYENQRLFDQAEPLYLRALEVRERVLGEEHPDTLVSANNLAGPYRVQGFYKQAEPLYIKTLLARERILGKEHRDTLTSVNNLAVLYFDQDLYGQAEPLFLRALNGRESVLGAEHPDTLFSVNTLASLYASQGLYDQAEPLFLRALEASERLLGEKHPNTLISMSGLADLYLSQGLIGQAELLFIRTLEARKRILGAEHPDTLHSVNSLARLYELQGLIGQAEPFYISTLEVRERILGKEHPDTLASVNNLALLYQSQGLYGLAEPLSIRAMEVSERVLGKEHPNTLISASNLGLIYRSQDLYGQAEPIYLRVLAIAERVLGPNRLDISTTYVNQARLLKTGFDATELSITYQKRAANIALSTEQSFGSSNDTTRAAFRKTKLPVTLTLQEWLIESNRLHETELIGRLAKHSGSDGTVQTIPFTPLEQKWMETSDSFNTDANGEAAPLEGIQASHIAWREEVAALPAETLAADAASFGTSLQDDAIAQLAALGPDVAMLQIASFEEETHFFLLSPSDDFQHTSIPIGEEAIAEAIFEVRDQLGLFEPSRSSRAGAPADGGQPPTSEAELNASLAELHQMLIAPVSDMLDAAGIETLILNLQGRLRYAPFAALYDEARQEYLTERFRLSRFTWGNLDYDKPADFTRAAGFGASQAFAEFAALPGVTQELDAILTGPDGIGVLEGTAALDTSFTKAALEEALANPPAIVHIASHFDMRPDDSGNSALLLGDGTRLTLKEITATPELTFEGVELLVLSACSTARSTEGTGLEVEGLGALAQLRGAEAVMATLWNVADASTADFMTDFYTRLTKSGLSKSEALRQAQIKMIQSKEYNHPYYWAPYILMGNWR